ncbi:hypothetical protein NE237_024116 [Protea cynaroides]|uniref:Uncharacterized protein n=1 Tax=Protea cynaroides TaxID=273540 RepID=A0A9Q0HD19_9MAGN|nr:hypothetical protein NE237_024116 [Protea cynaroides]
MKSFLRRNVGSKKTKKEEVRERRGFESEEERVKNGEREEEEGVATRDLVGFHRHQQICFDISLMAICFLFSSMERSDFLRVSQCSSCSSNTALSDCKLRRFHFNS